MNCTNCRFYDCHTCYADPEPVLLGDATRICCRFFQAKTSSPMTEEDKLHAYVKELHEYVIKKSAEDNEAKKLLRRIDNVSSI